MTAPQECLTHPLWPDTGRLLGIGRSAIYAAARRGDISTIRIGRKILVPKVALDRLLAEAGTRRDGQEG